MVKRIVAVGNADAAPIKRLIAAVPEQKCIILTGGRRRETVLVLDTGHLVITALSLEQALRLLRLSSAQSDE